MVTCDACLVISHPRSSGEFSGSLPNPTTPVRARGNHPPMSPKRKEKRLSFVSTSNRALSATSTPAISQRPRSSSPIERVRNGTTPPWSHVVRVLCAHGIAGVVRPRFPTAPARLPTSTQTAHVKAVAGVATLTLTRTLAPGTVGPP